MPGAEVGDDLGHCALFYRDQREYLTSSADFARRGLADGEPVFIAVPGHRDRMVRAGLGEDSRRVTYADMAQTGRNPARIIPEVMAFADAHPGHRVRFLGEQAWPGRSAAELREVIRHEALVNKAFTGTQARIMCLYDAGGLARPVIGQARCTHPAILAGGAMQASARYAGADSMPAECERPLPPPPAHAEAFGYRTELRGIRRLVEDHAAGCGLSIDRTANFVLAASELAGNTLRHTGQGGTLHVWHTSLEVICQVQDQGWITDPLAGRTRRPAAEPGHGLWVVNQVCDLVELRTGPGGTTIRLHMSLRPHPDQARSALEHDQGRPATQAGPGMQAHGGV